MSYLLLQEWMKWWLQSHLAHLEMAHLEMESIASFMPILLKLFQLMGYHLERNGMQST